MTDEELIEQCCRAMCKTGGLDPDEMMPNDGPRWRYYEPQARAVIPVAQAPKDARIAELEKALKWIIEQDQRHYSHWQQSLATGDSHLRQGYKDGPFAVVARNALRSTQ